MEDIQERNRDLPLAIVFGAAGGMGSACARRLGERHRVVLADIDIARLDALAAQLRTEGLEVIVHACDVGDLNAIAQLAQATEAWGPVRSLAYVVGLSPSMADWRRIVTVNLIGGAKVAEAMLPRMALGGAAVFISSIAPLDQGFLDAVTVAAGGEPSSNMGYSISKLGLMRLCERLAPSWGARGVRIVSLSPGIIATPMGALEFRENPGKRALFALSPLARQGSMLEIMDALEFLCSERASFITGTDLLVDGGLVAAVKTQQQRS